MSIYDVIRRINQEIDNVIIYFSSGKDSLVMLDLFAKYFNNFSQCKFVYLFYVENIKYRNEYFKKIENKYNIKIEQLPHYELNKYYNNNVYGLKTLYTNIKTSTENDNYIRNKYNISYIAYGYKKIDSYSRRGIIWHGNGIDKRNRKLYPVADFTNKHIFEYINRNRLLMAPEYQSGFQDINNYFSKNSLL